MITAAGKSLNSSLNSNLSAKTLQCPASITRMNKDQCIPAATNDKNPKADSADLHPFDSDKGAKPPSYTGTNIPTFHLYSANNKSSNIASITRTNHGQCMPAAADNDTLKADGTDPHPFNSNKSAESPQFSDTAISNYQWSL